MTILDDYIDNHQIRLTFIKHDEIDSNEAKIIPFSFQVHQNHQSNRIIYYHIEKEELVNPIKINPSSKNVEHLYEDDEGYNCFTTCRSSNYNKLGEFRMSLFTIYKEKLE